MEIKTTLRYYNTSTWKKNLTGTWSAGEDTDDWIYVASRRAK